MIRETYLSVFVYDRMNSIANMTTMATEAMDTFNKRNSIFHYNNISGMKLIH